MEKIRFKMDYANLPEKQKENILKQYKLEIRYAKFLKNTSDRLKRGKLYQELYSDFFNKLPEHPFLIRSKNKKYIENKVNRIIRFLRPSINKSTKIIEIGSGECSLTLGLSPFVEEVVGVDVVEDIMPNKSTLPNNVKLYISEDGTTLPFQLNYFHVAYSNQLLEHLHPEDVILHFANVEKILASNGCYIFQTPHKYFGPHDVSVFFHNKPVGFHLKEYCNYELYFLLKKTGFSKINLITGIKKHRINLPILIPIIIEFILIIFPFKIRKYLSLLTPIRKCLNGHIIARK